MKIKLDISRRDLAKKNYSGGATQEITEEPNASPDLPKLIAEALYKILFSKEGTNNASKKTI